MNASTPITLRRGIIAASFGAALLVVWVLVAPQVVSSKEIHVGTHTLQVELATTQAQHALGLGGRASLPEDHGMLFVFPDRGSYPFWMKGMKFPLDIVWIDRGTVTEVVTLKPPASPDDPPQQYDPKLPADRVLEINADTAKKLGIGPGTALQLPK